MTDNLKGKDTYAELLPYVRQCELRYHGGLVRLTLTLNFVCFLPHMGEGGFLAYASTVVR